MAQETGKEFFFVPISSIVIMSQVRSMIDTVSESFLALVESIKLYDILEPLIVMALGDGTYRLICGERRLLAAQAAGLTEVPVKFIPEGTSEAEISALQLTENLQRQDLNPIDEANSILKYLHIKHADSNQGLPYALGVLVQYNRRPQDLANTVATTVVAISQITGKSITALHRTLSLLKTENEIQEALKTGALPVTQGYTFAAHLDNPNHMKIFAEVMANPVTNAALEKMLATKPKAVKETKPTTLTLTRQSKAVDTWTTNIGKDAKVYTREDLTSFREKLQTLCEMVDKKIGGIGEATN
jgi:ParB family transcriptional regulator, chromosome partitioning protein